MREQVHARRLRVAPRTGKRAEDAGAPHRARPSARARDMESLRRADEREAVREASRDGRGIANAADRNRRLAAGLSAAGLGTRVIAVSELPLVITAPRPESTIREERQALPIAGGQRRDAG